MLPATRYLRRRLASRLKAANSAAQGAVRAADEALGIEELKIRRKAQRAVTS